MFAQSVSCTEVVVVDDGSTDETRTKLARYGSRVVLIAQPNRGAASARNTGVAAATSEYIAFLDADDLWHSRKLELQVRAMQRHPDAVACFTDFEYLSKYDDFDGQRHVSFETRVLPDTRAVFANPYFGTPTVMVRRATFNAAHGFDETLLTAEDVDLWLRLGLLGSVVHLAEILTGVVQHGSGLSMSSGVQGDYNNLLVIERFTKANPSFAKHSARLVRQTESQILTRIGATLLSSDDRSAARAVLLKALRSDPFSFRPLYLLLKSLTPAA